MSASLYKWTPGCDGSGCPGDCDHCNKNENEEEIRMDINERIKGFLARRDEAFHLVMNKYDMVSEHLGLVIGEELGLASLGFRVNFIGINGKLNISGFGKSVGDFTTLFDNPVVSHGTSQYCGEYDKIEGTYKGVPCSASVYYGI